MLNRGIVMGVSNYIVLGTPRDNMIAMIEMIRENR